MNTVQVPPPENWALIRPGYDNFIAIPLSQLSDFLNHYKVVKEDYNKDEKLSTINRPLDLKIVSGEAMAVMQVREKMTKPATE